MVAPREHVLEDARHGSAGLGIAPGPARQQGVKPLERRHVEPLDQTDISR
jgi:hypothetical protein